MGLESRKIIHIDMDAFFAAVEQRDFPEYRNRPVIVGGAPDSRGVVSTCSYEARTFGVRSAMPASQAYRLCPHAVFLRPRFDAYREVSADVRAILLEFTDWVEPLSLDEAYLDVTGSAAFRGSATLIAKEIKRRILAKTGLIASAGVSYNKFLAKIASDLDKPDGLCLISPDEGPGFVETLPVGRFHGVGKATEAKMKALGIETGRDLKRFSLQELCLHFGKAGRHYYQIARGIDERPVIAERPRKSLGAERTFQSDLGDPAVMLSQLEMLTGPLLAKLAERGLVARTLTVKVRYADFEAVTRSRTRDLPFRTVQDVLPHLAELMKRTEAGTRQVRLLGLSFSTLDIAGPDAAIPRQLDLFS